MGETISCVVTTKKNIFWRDDSGLHTYSTGDRIPNMPKAVFDKEFALGNVMPLAKNGAAILDRGQFAHSDTAMHRGEVTTRRKQNSGPPKAR